MPSWQADAPTGAAIELQLRAGLGQRWTRWYSLGQRWTRWYSLGRWSSAAAQRHSVEAQHDDDGRVATDTLLLSRPASALQWRVVLLGSGAITPELRVIAVALGPVPEADPQPLPVIAPLPVPALSQMVYPEGRPVWCSPTALTMLLASWFARTGAAQLAPSLIRRASRCWSPQPSATRSTTARATGRSTPPTPPRLSSYVVQLSGLSELAGGGRAAGGEHRLAARRARRCSDRA